MGQVAVAAPGTTTDPTGAAPQTPRAQQTGPQAAAALLRMWRRRGSVVCASSAGGPTTIGVSAGNWRDSVATQPMVTGAGGEAVPPHATTPLLGTTAMAAQTGGAPPVRGANRHRLHCPCGALGGACAPGCFWKLPHSYQPPTHSVYF
ncbi:MAG: hypothetical protein EOM68_12420 [Spirochaetia bacterium]|nr:hypothetical protein [Spirochaetia bacterium]